METLATLLERAPWMVAVWLGVLGAVIGSFLNVVIYRMPLGLNLSRPSSHCPKCGHAIRPWHNVPVLGWLWLRGRCHDCHASVSIRYPLVEAATGLLFAGLAVAELGSFGMNLPLRDPHGAVLMTDVLATYAYHLVLLSCLLCAALIEYDGHFIEYDGQKIPRRLTTFVLVTGCVAPLFWPSVHPIAYRLWAPLSEPWMAGAADTLCGAAIGAVLAGAAVLLLRPGRRQVAWPLAWVGVYLGWQSALIVGLALLAVSFTMWLLSLGWPRVARLPITGLLFVLTLVWIVFWHELARWMIYSTFA